MIREYVPIALIPAAWAITLAMITYPGLETYWIQSMHYLMILFLGGFTALSWKEMSSPVLVIWRKMIAVGILFTGLGALSFSFTGFSYFLKFLSLSYWFLAPSVALYYSSEYMDKCSMLYRRLAYGSAIGYVILILGIYADVISLQMIAFAGVAVIQTMSIVTASRLDNEE